MLVGETSRAPQSYKPKIGKNYKRCFTCMAVCVLWEIYISRLFRSGKASELGFGFIGFVNVRASTLRCSSARAGQLAASTNAPLPTPSHSP